MTNNSSDSQLVAPKVLLAGDSGTGKSYSLRTLIEAGMELFWLCTEPSEVLDDIPDGKIHKHYVSPASTDFKAMINMARNINALSFESLTKISDADRSKYLQWVEVLQNLANFHCNTCGKDFGDVTEWDSNRVLVIDSLSGLNIMAMNLVVGGKPVRSQPDWMIAQNNLEGLIQKLCLDTRCMFVLTAHIESEMDEVSGSSRLMPSTLGRKLGPKIPRFFSDVIHVKREAKKFTWSTATYNVVSKARNLPIEEAMSPSFVPLLKAWRERGSAAKPLHNVA